MEADNQRARLSRVHAALVGAIAVVQDALHVERRLDDDALRELAWTLTRASNELLVTGEAERLETRPAFRSDSGES